MDAGKKVLGYLSQGCCCTEALVRFGLELLEEDCDLLADAAYGLCGGMHTGGVCGVLTGGCMVLSMADRENAAEMIREYCGWYKDTFAAKSGSSDCSAIRSGSPSAGTEICMPMVRAAGEKLYEILRENGTIE